MQHSRTGRVGRKSASPARQGGLTAPDRTRCSTAKLVYSSLGNCARDGPCSGAETLVQAVCTAGDFAIDLQIEPEFEAAQMALVGQVVNQAVSDEPLAGAAVRLMERRELLAMTGTNGFGEFCFVSRWQNGLTIEIEIEGAARRVRIPLDKLTKGFRL